VRAALVVLCCAPALAWAQGSPVTLTNTLVLEAHGDNGNADPSDDDYQVLIDRLNLQASMSELVLSLRLDAVGFLNVPPGARYESDVRPERVSLRYNAGSFELTAGDFQRQLGRGILLSIRKVDEVGLDLSLRGADVRWTPEGHAFGVFAGVLNPSNLDAVSLDPLDDPGDLVAGLSYELGAIDQLVIGAHGLYLQPSDRLLDTLDYTVSGGGYVELHELLPGLSLYGEGDVQSRRLAGTDELGYAAYVTADASFGDLAILLEGLWLADFQQKGSQNGALLSSFDLNQVPTLERIDQEVLNNRDVRGVRARAEYSLREGDWIAYLNGVLRFNDLDLDTEIRQIHAYAGAEHHFDEDASKAILSAGFRTETRSMDGASVKQIIHGELDVVKSIGEALAVHLDALVEVRSSEALRPGEHWLRGSTFIGGEWARVGGLTVEIGYDTEKAGQRHFFFAALLAMDLTDAIRLRAVAGTQRGGLKCANGVCRDFPEFAGARAELVARL